MARKPLVLRNRITKVLIPYYVKGEDVLLNDGTYLEAKLADIIGMIGTGGYTPPPTGIPADDLAGNIPLSKLSITVQQLLALANTALQEQTQADWDEENSSSPAFIRHKPEIPEGAEVAQSVQENDTRAVAGGAVYNELQGKASATTVALLRESLDAITGGDTTTAIRTFNEVVTFLANIEDTETLEGIIAGLQTEINKKYTKPLTGIPASDLEGNIPADKLSQGVQTSLGKADTALQSETDPTVPDWAKQPTKPTYTAQEVGALPADTVIPEGAAVDPFMSSESTNSVQNRVIKAYVDSAVQAVQTALNTLIGGNVQGAIDTFNEVVTFLNGIDTSDPTLRNQLLALSTDITTLSNSLATVATSGSYNDLTNKPTIPSVDGFVTDQEVAGMIEDAIEDLPTGDIPTKVSDLTNDLGFIQASQMDNAPTAGSKNPVTSGGVKTYVDNKATITGITTRQDGTFTISLSDGNSYTVVLNHVHPQYQPLLTAGTNITIAEDQQTGNLVISASGGGTQVQANWNESDSTSAAYIQNKPTIPIVPTNVSSFTNDAGYLTSHQSLSGYAKYVLLADEAAYNALQTKESDTLYLIPES